MKNEKYNDINGTSGEKRAAGTGDRSGVKPSSSVGNAPAGKKNGGKKSGGLNNGGGKSSFAQGERRGNNYVRDRDGRSNGGGNRKGNGKNKQEKNRNADDGRKDTYVYALDGNLYVNLTNKCSNGCHFCVRNERASYYGNYLWIRHGDPTAEKVIAAINGMGDLSAYKELVFCGFGEPTYKMEELLAVADYAHSKGLPTRLNTNGQGNLINKRDIPPELKDRIDKVNISLNASCAEKYQPICRSMFGEAGYTAILDFARQCKRAGIECRFSVVDVVGEDEVSACKRVADSVGVPLYVRKYITDS